MTMRYFAMTNDEKIVDLGECINIAAAECAVAEFDANIHALSRIN